MVRLLAAAWAALALAGCASERAREQEGPAGAARPRMVALEELPPRQRALLEAYGKGGEEWERARAGAREDPELARFLVENLVVEMVRAWEGMAGARAAQSRTAFERARAELARMDGAAAPVLAELLALADDVVATLAAQALEGIGRPAVAPVASLLPHASAAARRRAAALLGALPHAAEEEGAVRAALAERLAGDGDWMVRAASARALGARGARDRETTPARAALERALFDADPAVAAEAAAGLLRLRDPRSVPALIAMLERGVRDGEPRRVNASQAALRGLTGLRRDPGIDGWRAWWLANGDRIRAQGGSGVSDTE